MPRMGQGPAPVPEAEPVAIEILMEMLEDSAVVDQAALVGAERVELAEAVDSRVARAASEERGPEVRVAALVEGEPADSAERMGYQVARAPLEEPEVRVVASGEEEQVDSAEPVGCQAARVVYEVREPVGLEALEVQASAAEGEEALGAQVAEGVDLAESEVAEASVATNPSIRKRSCASNWKS
jgi:hypothetical protein